MIKYFYFILISLFVKLLGLIPKKQGKKLGSLLGQLLFIIDKKHRNIAIKNLSYAFKYEKNEHEIKQHALEVFKNLGKILFEIAWAWNLDEKQLMKYFKIKGLSNIENANKKGKGILALTGHFGNWELLTITAFMIAHPVNIVYRPLDFKPLDNFVRQVRTRFGAKVIHSKKAIRTILKKLKNQEIVAILLDQSVDWYEGVFVDFFGHRTCTNKGMALLALKTEAPVIPVFLIREKDGFTAKFFPEIPLIKTGDKIKDIENNTKKYNKAIEDIIRQYPDQWFWVHRRWKIKPYQTWPKNKII